MNIKLANTWPELRTNIGLNILVAYNMYVCMYVCMYVASSEQVYVCAYLKVDNLFMRCWPRTLKLQCEYFKEYIVLDFEYLIITARGIAAKFHTL